MIQCQPCPIAANVLRTNLRLKPSHLRWLFSFLVAHKAACNAKRVFLPSLLRRLSVYHQNGNRRIHKTYHLLIYTQSRFPCSQAVNRREWPDNDYWECSSRRLASSRCFNNLRYADFAIKLKMITMYHRQ